MAMGIQRRLLLISALVASLTTAACTRSLAAPPATAAAAARAHAAGAVPLARRAWASEPPRPGAAFVPDGGVFHRTALRSDAFSRSARWVPTQADAKGPEGGGGGDLAAAAQNPIASTISMPFEQNLLLRAGPEDNVAYVMNFQPVIPINVGDWNLVNRPILPVQYMPGVVEGIPSHGNVPVGLDSAFGIGDLNYTVFLSPADSKGLIWGIGPSITFPTATDDVLGAGKWSAGPSVVALTIQKPWLAGMLVRQMWSFAGEEDRADTNNFMIQPFVNYNLSDGWYLLTAPVITSNWDAPSDQQWLVPIGGGVGRIFKIGNDQPVSMNLQLYYNAVRQDTAPDWHIRLGFQLIFPK